MTESENKRNNPDRRKYKIKNFKNNQRQTIRRKEDRNNKLSYYFMITFLGCLLIFMITISVVFDK